MLNANMQQMIMVSFNVNTFGDPDVIEDDGTNSNLVDD